MHQFTLEQAQEIAKKIGISENTAPFDIEQFLMGINVEIEHGAHDPQTNVTNNDPLMTGKIALAHLREYPDYYTRLAKMEKEAEAFFKDRT